ncbi:hypothetical protein BKA65DRAFT_540954 [Rhexocercosporidium sp. MPI-PUGE-AT-0058]|nr:hypothetical protein BKA65DRAFT_540954 [Rhexocercosporidium sp. MPI-PUGE-AT-0058]
MSTTRLLFLYPPLFRLPSLRISHSSRQKSGRSLLRGSQFHSQPHSHSRFPCLHSRNRAGARELSTSCSSSSFSSSLRSTGARNGRRVWLERMFATTARRQERHIKRHGKAVEPFLAGGEAEGESADGGKLDASEKKEEQEGRGEGGVKSADKSAGMSVEAKGMEGEKGGEKLGEKEKEKHVAKEPSSSAPLSEETQNAARVPGDKDADAGSGSGRVSSTNTGTEQPGVGKTEAAPSSSNSATSTSSNTPPNPLETVLHMPPPETAEEENASKPPHLQTPPYVHHFDTYTLVQQVEAGGFSNEAAITSMKAVRGLLALNLEVARKGLVSKSDVENETYLFRAACSELKTEIQNTRKKNEEAMRRERTLLQHEVDILNQKLSQELLTLKDDLKGMFDDRKMSVRMEQRTMESKIQELNYKITVLLNSDSKSEIEGLRWVLTRRSVMGILFMAFMVLTSLRYASYKSHEDELRAKKKKDEVLKVEGLVGAGGGETAQGVAEILAAN